LVLTAGVVCLFIPGLQGVGVSILIGWGSSFLISVALNGGKVDKNTFLEAAIGGALGLFGMGLAGGVSKGLGTAFGQKVISSLAGSKVLGSLIRGGSNLIRKLPGPIQQMLGKMGFIGSVEGVGTSIVDDLLHGKKIDWKKAAISGLAGAALVGVGAFVAPKLQPIVDRATTVVKAYTKPIVAKVRPSVKKLEEFDLGNCFGYKEQYSYFAIIRTIGLEFEKCFYSPDSGNGSGSGGKNKEVSNPNPVENSDPNIVNGVKKPPVTLEEFNKIRQEFNPPLPPRKGDDDPNTVAVLRGDGFEFKSKNAHGKQNDITKELAVNNVSKTHAEIGALFELYKIRKSRGALGGEAVLYVDKAPCGYCRSKYDLNAIKNMVEQLRIDKLHVYYLDQGKMKEWVVEPDPPFKRMPWSVTKEEYEIQRKQYTKKLAQERAKERRKKKNE
jgi:hypothetical protein